MTKLYKTHKTEVSSKAELSKTMPDGSIVIAYREPDQDCGNPCKDCDGVGQVRSLSSRHIDNIDVDEAIELLKADPMVVALSYFEHGNCLWDVAGGECFAACPDKQWDGVSFAGVWIPDECCRDEIKSRYEQRHGCGPVPQAEANAAQHQAQGIQAIARVLAAECCTQYTAWSNGDCWGYIVERYSPEGEFISQVDSCWGFIGSEYSEQAMKEAFDAVTE